MEDNGDISKSVSEQASAIEPNIAQTTVTTENGTTVVTKVSDANQDLDDFRTDSKWEFTPLEKASYDCSDMYLETTPNQQDQPTKEVEPQPDQTKVVAEDVLAHHQQDIEPTEPSSKAEPESVCDQNVDAQERHSCSVDPTQVDNNMEKVIDSLVESSENQQTSQTSDLQSKESFENEDVKQVPGVSEEEPQDPTSKIDMAAVSDEPASTEKQNDGNSCELAVTESSTNDLKTGPADEPETTRTLDDSNCDLTDELERRRSSESSDIKSSASKSPSKTRKSSKRQKSNIPIENEAMDQIQASSISQTNTREQSSIEDDPDSDKPDTLEFIEATRTEATSDELSQDTQDEISDLVVDQTTISMNSFVDDTNDQSSNDKKQSEHELSESGEECKLTEAKSSTEVDIVASRDDDISTEKESAALVETDQPIQRPVRTSRTRNSTVHFQSIETPKPTRSGRKSRVVNEEPRSETIRSEESEISKKLADPDKIENEKEEQEAMLVEEPVNVKPSRVSKGRGSTKLSNLDLPKIKVDRRPSKRHLETETTPEAYETPISTPKTVIGKRSKVNKLASTEPSKTSILPKLSDLLTHTSSSRTASKHSSYSRGNDSTYENDGIERKYRCNQCGFSTDRLNNIVYHHKHLFLCKGGQKLHEAMVEQWKHSPEFAKSNKRRHLK